MVLKLLTKHPQSAVDLSTLIGVETIHFFQFSIQRKENGYGGSDTISCKHINPLMAVTSIFSVPATLSSHACC